MAGAEPDFWTPNPVWDARADGTILLRLSDPLPPDPGHIPAPLFDWAARTPDRRWLAERCGDTWGGVTYAEGARAVQGIASALLARGLGPQRPLLILSGNSVAYGLMALGVVLKLVPISDQDEARVTSPSVTPGYWRAPALSAKGFGDALRLADPQDPGKGVQFGGRLAENCKLASGTWVSVGALRQVLTDALDGLESDTILAGEGRGALGALILPDRAKIAARQGRPASDPALLTAPRRHAEIAHALARPAAQAPGSARRVTRVTLLTDALRLAAGEVTDKGSVTARAVLRNRPHLLDRLWSDTDPAVIRPATEKAA